MVVVVMAPGSAGFAPERVAPIDAATTHPMASHWTGDRCSCSTTIAASAAAAGSRLIRMPNTAGRRLRSATSSQL